MMPPSPRLFARSTRTTYFSDTTIISDQKIADSASQYVRLGERDAVRRRERLLDGVQGTGADVAVDDAKREQRQCGGRLRGLSAGGGGCVKAGSSERSHGRAAYAHVAAAVHGEAILYAFFTRSLR